MQEKRRKKKSDQDWMFLKIIILKEIIEGVDQMFFVLSYLYVWLPVFYVFSKSGGCLNVISFLQQKQSSVKALDQHAVFTPIQQVVLRIFVVIGVYYH